MENSDIIDVIAKELGYNRFCGTIAAKNSSRKLNSQEECELADVLASNNLSLFREDALRLLKKILEEIMSRKDCDNITELRNLNDYVKTRHELLANREETQIEIEEILNPITNLEI